MHLAVHLSPLCTQKFKALQVSLYLYWAKCNIATALIWSWLTWYLSLCLSILILRSGILDGNAHMMPKFISSVPLDQPVLM